MMGRQRPRPWLPRFLLGASAVLFVLGGLTVMTLDLEEQQRSAAREAASSRTLTEALLRMDSWLAPQLELEALRPHFHYQSFFSLEHAYTRLLGQIERGEVLSPSPLLWFRSEIFPLHFQIDVSGKISSPQAPEGNLRDLAEGRSLSREDLPRMIERLEAWRSQLDREVLLALLPAAETTWNRLLGDEPDLSVTSNEIQSLDNRQVQSIAGTRSNLGWRAKTSRRVATPESVARESVEVGRLLPLWLPGEAKTLVFARTAVRGGECILQGFVADWPALERALLAQIEDLAPRAGLRPVPPNRRLEARDPGLLGTVPALFEPGPLPELPGRASSVTGVLALTWLVVLLALGGFAVALRRTAEIAERRRRFASAVTHELRTPLTTFRLYSELLADGMVQDPEKVRLYLRTLQSESDRLGSLVENVLDHSRLEEGRSLGRKEEITVAALVDRLQPRLEALARSAGRAIRVDRREEDGPLDRARLCINVEAVGQVLVNLVDNALKYGCAGDAAAVVVLEVTSGDRHCELTVRDAGPGVPPERRREIFRVFDRGGRDEADDVPGIGLGLALARGLARDQGGELDLLASDTGAAFRLTLPRLRGAGRAAELPDRTDQGKA